MSAVCIPSLASAFVTTAVNGRLVSTADPFHRSLNVIGHSGNGVAALEAIDGTGAGFGASFSAGYFEPSMRILSPLIPRRLSCRRESPWAHTPPPMAVTETESRPWRQTGLLAGGRPSPHQITRWQDRIEHRPDRFRQSPGNHRQLHQPSPRHRRDTCPLRHKIPAQCFPLAQAFASVLASASVCQRPRFRKRLPASSLPQAFASVLASASVCM